MTPDEKAEAAKLILESSVVKHAFNDVRENLVLKLESIPTDEPSEANYIKHQLQALKMIRVQLEKYLQVKTMKEHRRRQDAFVEKTRERLPSLGA